MYIRVRVLPFLSTSFFDDSYHSAMSVQVEEDGEEFSVLFKRESPDGEENLTEVKTDVNGDHGKELVHESSSDEEDDQTALIQPQETDYDIGNNVLQLIEPQKNTSTIGGASFNFINSIIGAGAIGIASAMRQAGFLVGLMLLISVGVVTDYTILLLIKDGIMANKFTYQEMVSEAFGRPGYWFLTVGQFLLPFTGMLAYTVIVGDTFSRIMVQFFTLIHDDEPPALLVDPRILKVALTLLVMLPVSMLRNVSKLEKFSAFAILCILFIVGVTIYEASQLYCAVRCFEPDCCDSHFTTWVLNKDFLAGFGIMTTAFVCHHNTYLIYDSLKQRSHTRFSRVTHISVFSSLGICVTIGLAGFLTFMKITQGDLLNNYCEDDVVANVTRFFYACVIMLTYPIECFVAREVLEISISKIPYKAIAWIPIQTVKKGVDRFLFTPRHKSLTRHIVLTVVIVMMALAIGVSTNDLGVVLAFSGCFTGVPLVYILPPACYLKLSKQPWCSRGKIISTLLVILGVVVMVLGTIQTSIQAVQSYAHQEEYHPPYCADSDPYETCCRLAQATSNFTSPVRFCNCESLCTLSSFTSNETSRLC